jgi:hypothetical protein
MSEISHYTYKFVFDDHFIIGGNSIAQLCNDIYDEFDLHYEMYIERNDGKEMTQKEIRELRKDIFEDMDEDFSLINSQYKNKKLYFYNEGIFWYDTNQEHILGVINLYEEMGYEIIKNTNESVFCDFFMEKQGEKKAILCRYWYSNDMDYDFDDPDGDKDRRETEILKFLNYNISGYDKLIINFFEIYDEIQELINAKAEFIHSDEIRKQRNWYIAEEMDDEARNPYFVDEERFDKYLTELIININKSKTNDEKKRSMEDLGFYILNNLDGVSVEKRDLRSSAEECDLLISNESKDPFFGKLGSPIVVECRNRETSFSAKDLRDFKGKIESLGLNCGLIISKRGLTGTIDGDAKFLIRESRTKGITIIPLELSDIEFVAEGADLVRIMKKKYYDLFQL